VNYKTVQEEIELLKQAKEDMAGRVPLVCQERMTARIREAKRGQDRGRLCEGQLVIDAGLSAFGIRIAEDGVA